MQQYHYNLSNTALRFDNLEHDLIDDGIFIPPKQIKLVEIPVAEIDGYIEMFDNPHIPDSIFTILNQRILIPIHNYSAKIKHITTS